MSGMTTYVVFTRPDNPYVIPRERCRPRLVLAQIDAANAPQARLAASDFFDIAYMDLEVARADDVRTSQSVKALGGLADEHEIDDYRRRSKRAA